MPSEHIWRWLNKMVVASPSFTLHSVWLSFTPRSVPDSIPTYTGIYPAFQNYKTAEREIWQIWWNEKRIDSIALSQLDSEDKPNRFDDWQFWIFHKSVFHKADWNCETISSKNISSSLVWLPLNILNIFLVIYWNLSSFIYIIKYFN